MSNKSGVAIDAKQYSGYTSSVDPTIVTSTVPINREIVGTTNDSKLMNIASPISSDYEDDDEG